jgi:formylglycine-generating enzyme required for sulfatase activity
MYTPIVKPVWVVIVAGSTLLSAQTVPPTAHGLSELLDGSGFVRIRAGEFVMGSTAGQPDERPPHRVRISRDFEIGKYEVTQAQWETVMRSGHMSTANPAQRTDPSRFKGADLPVENISWDEVQQFLRALNSRDPKYTYRLPTEAEWEYAARAGREGDAKGDLDATAWYEVNSDGKTHPVGQKQPNAWGLYDVDGNVREWVEDWYGPDYYENSPPADPRGPDSGSYRVYRGGCWFAAAKYCRPAARTFDFPVQRYDSVGFRLVRTPK